ncbi:MAG TPA: hypothetical protein VNK04_25115 [Gemmataceae bacterium]|jgi:hypothetical protein|nr:hypothetical protein [Gemmataceae bacterium]
MHRKPIALDLLIRAALKLDPRNGERQNVLAFVQSCYGGWVRSYDFDAALRSLSKLTGEEQRTLVEYVLRGC